VHTFETPVVGFVGRSGAGKTQFLERLILFLRSKGWRLAVVKHTHRRGLQTDQPGSDSYRFWEAGANHVTLATPDRVVHTHRHETDPLLSEVIADIQGVDLILVEGYKSSSVPKLEVVRAESDRHPLEHVSHRLAFITDVPELQNEGRWFGLGDVQGVAHFLIDAFVDKG